MGVLLPSPEAYRSLVGKFNFLTHTHLYLSFVVQYLSQYLQCPTDYHIKETLYLLSYLRGTSTTGFFILTPLTLFFQLSEIVIGLLAQTLVIWLLVFMCC